MPSKRKPPADIPTGLAFAPTDRRRRFSGAPARDLEPADLARLAYRREMARVGTSGIRPSTNPDPAAIAEITAELVSSGLYTPKRQAKEA